MDKNTEMAFYTWLGENYRSDGQGPALYNAWLAGIEWRRQEEDNEKYGDLIGIYNAWGLRKDAKK